MDQHQVEGFGARLLAQVGEQRDVAADQSLQSRSDGAKDGTRPDNNPAHLSQRARHVELVQLKLRRPHVVRVHSTTTCVAGCHCCLSSIFGSTGGCAGQAYYSACRVHHSNSARMKNSCDETSYSTCRMLGLQQTWQSST